MPGHIAGAANIPWAKAANDDGTFKTADELRELYEAEGITSDREIIAYCRIGERSLPHLVRAAGAAGLRERARTTTARGRSTARWSGAPVETRVELSRRPRPSTCPTGWGGANPTENGRLGEVRIPDTPTARRTTPWPSARKSTSRSSSKGYRFDWKDSDHSVFTPKRGLSPAVVEEISALKNEPEWMRKIRLKACGTSTCGPCPGGAPTCPTSTSRTSTTSSARRRSRPRTGRTCPRTSRGPGTSWGSPRPRRSTWAASAPSTSPRSSTTRSRRSSTTSGVLFTDMDSALRDYPDLVQGVLRHDHPAQRQQVRRAQHGRVVGRVVHLRAAGRAGRHPAAGVLPHQRREHGPVRADADHRRRGQLRALRRGLLGPDLHQRLAALGGGRDRGEEGRAGPVHDDPELVDQRLQPGDQARGRRTRTP